MGDPDGEIRLSLENIGLFAEECIIYVLRWFNLDWYPPVTRDALRVYSRFNLFTVEIGKALAHSCMIAESILLGELALFDIDAWLQMPLDEARNYESQHFLHFIFVLPVRDDFKHLYLWAYACYLCRQAVTHNRRDLLFDVLIQLVIVMYSNYKYFSHYDNLHAQATLYNSIHFILHSPLGS